ncbi:MAG TPA: DUF3237 family protein [Phnomibacter sp.]|nr:DUF3237 family protein [Phnomibacter sp.]
MKKQLNEMTTSLFDEQVHLTGVVEYGISWEDMLYGRVAIPPEGARFDMSFEGEIKGDLLAGKVKGIDYLEVRADGRFMLTIYATIVTHDGETIALYEEGIMDPKPGASIGNLALNLKFTTHSPKYRWLNKTNGWGLAQVFFHEGRVSVTTFTHEPILDFQLN